MTVIGIDSSMTRTAVAIIDGDEFTAASHPTKGTRKDTYAERAIRILQISTWVFSVIPPKPALIVIEGPSTGPGASGSAHDRSGLWWNLYLGLSVNNQVAVPTPTQRAKYATGNGGAGKDEVLLSVARRWPDYPVANNDEADALVLAAMGMDYLGSPTVTLPKSHLDALAKVAWGA